MREAIDAFERFLADSGVSTATRSNYVGDARRFAAYLDERGVELSSVTEDTVRAYLDALRGLGRSAATLSRAVASVRRLFEYLEGADAVAVNPAAGVSVVKPKRKLPEVLTSGEVALLLEQPRRNDPKGLRDKAMLELLYATGLRASELVALDCSDVNLATGLLRCRADNRDIPLYPAAVRAVSEYVANARGRMLSADGGDALFVNTDGARMSRQGFWKLIRRYGERAGITREITPTLLRSSFATHMLENGVDIRQLQEMLGHAGAASTQVYASVVRRQLKDTYLKAHPRARRDKS
ncbi:MAG: tyrosine-type recombinase/integrase [Oscillospiraceae bacterium]|nr:tyrosine-type recombinase/integrase [Oscillospiraceae bacterium]